MKMRHKRKPDIRRRFGVGFVITGTVLLLSVPVILAVNKLEDRLAGQKAELLLYDVQYAVENGAEQAQQSENGDTALETSAADTAGAVEVADVEESPVPKSPVAVTTEYECIGYISLPDLQLELPVIAEWDYERLNTAPCRHFGSVLTDDLVIAGHDFNTHFGRIPELKTGDAVLITDMNGTEHRYAVAGMPEVVSAGAVDAVRHSGHDLVLYTCTFDGDERIVVFCDRTA